MAKHSRFSLALRSIALSIDPSALSFLSARIFCRKYAERVLQRSPCRAGSISLEYAIILPLLLLFILGIVDVGRLLWTFATLSRATEAAARCGVVNASTCGTASQIQQDAITEAWGLPVTASTFAVSVQSCGLYVSANYSFTFFTPGFGPVAVNPAACFPQ